MTDSGIVIVDKPAGWTSHDVVARIRRLAGTRKVGHAGTLDPMATGVLVVGVGKGTKLLGHLALTEKAYEATIRLGSTTTTDDAEGEPVERAGAAGVTDDAVHRGVETLTGTIDQVPPRVSAVKVAGKRAYAQARAGNEVTLAARTVTVSEFVLHGLRRGTDESGRFVDLDARITCSSGTYVRSLARDLGVALATGGHLESLRRTRVGPYHLAQSITLEQLAEEYTMLPLARAVSAAFPSRTLSADETRKVTHGNWVASDDLGPGLVALYAPDGTVIALAEHVPGHRKPIVVFEAA